MPNLDQAPERARLAVGAVFFSNGCGLGLWASHIPIVRRGLDLSEGELGIALLSMAGGAIVAMPSMGWLANRYGSRRCALVTGLAFTLLLSLPLIAPSLAVLVVTTFFLGIANGSLDVSQTTQGSVVERRLGRPVMSYVNGFFSLGAVAGAALAGVLLSSGGPPAALLAAAGVGLAVIIAVASMYLLPEPADGAPGDHAFRLPGRAALTIGLLAFLGVLTEWAMMDWSTVFLSGELALSPAMAAFGFGAFSVAMMIGRFTGDRVVARFGPRRVLLLSGVLAGIGVALLATAPGPAQAVPGLALAGLGLSNLFPVLISAAARLPGMVPSAGVAAVATCAYFGGLIGPVLIGFGAEAFGLRGAIGLLVLACAAIAAAGFYGSVGRRLAVAPGS